MSLTTGHNAPLEWLLAIRFLREGRVQSILILMGVALGSAVIIYISALVSGLQKNIIDRTLGTQAHIIVRPPESVSHPVNLPSDAIMSAIQRPAQPLLTLDPWQSLHDDIQKTPGIIALSPTASGPALAIRGDASRSVTVIGVHTSRYKEIVNISEKMTIGLFAPGSGEAVIGVDLADDIGASSGDTFKLVTATGHEDTFRIAGIFDMGLKDLNRRWVIMPLRDGQALLEIPGEITHLDIRLADIFTADTVSATLSSRYGVDAESWMETQAQLMMGLRSQRASSRMIRLFVTISVAFGIASILVISVVQKSKEIGILRAMGLPARSVLIIFLLQGALIGLAGSIIGLVLGASWAILFAHLVKNPDGTAVFQASLTPALFASTLVLAALTGTVAAAIPALRAARLDPAEAIRHV